MSDTPSDENETPVTGQGFWPDETVDTICALVVVSAVTLMVLWFVVNG